MVVLPDTAMISPSQAVCARKSSVKSSMVTPEQLLSWNSRLLLYPDIAESIFLAGAYEVAIRVEPLPRRQSRLLPLRENPVEM